ncbi:hypothetical protein FA13DRAFT_1795135 [Coprinellus micaceus]|uniref:NACHT domain-containing protein n=1 Tax=Coprinellus micaceus TaxID=71717 RepID=A0A4Y7T0R0_COPMI|nr:hypothetical protein FA13DRAFT_1795135 [Coprinellus micaceus]
MSFLQEAHHFNVEQLNINAGGAGRHYDSTNFRDVLSSNVSFEAMHDSSQRADAPKCHAETRTAVQEEIMGWIVHGDGDEQPTRIMWLTGPAGSGKTAIMGTIAETCEERDLLGASFFFSSYAGTASRCSKRFLIPTLAHQMISIEGYGQLGEKILASVERTPMISASNATVARRVLIIDGLDEVSAETAQDIGRDEARQANEAEQVEILSTLLHAANDPSFPFRILIASRPERVIRGFFSSKKAKCGTRQLVLDNEYDPGADIALFLRSSFAEIRRRYNLPSSWASDDVVRTLVERASGQFIYAATVVRFLRSGTVPPHARLEYVLSLRHQGNPVNPFEPLDALYAFILNSSPNPVLAIQWVSVLEQHLTPDKIRSPRKLPRFVFAKQLLDEHPGQGDYLFENLSSLISVSSTEQESGPSYHLHHKSLVDFLLAPSRCGRTFYQAFSTAHNDLYLPRLAQILRTRSPLVPLDNSQYGYFVRGLLCLPVFRQSMESYIVWALERGGNHLLWDAHVAFLHFAAHDLVVASSCVVKLYSYFHSRCGPLPRDCSPTCRHWRSRILQSCRAFGWMVPTASDLFLQIVYVKMGGWIDICDHFWPPYRPVVPSPMLEYQPGWGTCDQEYEGYLAAAMAMYSKLSDDWETQFKAEVERGVRKDELYDRICRDVGQV